MNKLKLLISSMAATVLLVMVPGAALAANCTSGGSVANQLSCGAANASGTTNPPTPAESANNINNDITVAINIISVVGGIVAVIMLIIGGMRYAASGGDSSAVASAKNTMLYAIIGLILIALSQAVARFILKKIS